MQLFHEGRNILEKAVWLQGLGFFFITMDLFFITFSYEDK